MKQYAVTCVLYIDALDADIAETLAFEFLDDYVYRNIKSVSIVQTEEINEQE